MMYSGGFFFDIERHREKKKSHNFYCAAPVEAILEKKEVSHF